MHRILARGVRDAGIGEPRAGRTEHDRRQRKQRDAERALRIAVTRAQDEERDTDEQQERPEHRRRELDHRLEAVVLECAEPDQGQRDRALDQEGGHGRAPLRVPPPHEAQRRPVAGHRVIGARADDHRRVDRRERGDGDEQAQHLAAEGAERPLHDLHSRRLAFGEPLQSESGHEREVHEQVDDGNDRKAQHQGRHDRAPATGELGRDVRRLVPAAVGQEHEDHRQSEHAQRGSRGEGRGQSLRRPAGPGTRRRQRRADRKPRSP